MLIRLGACVTVRARFRAIRPVDLRFDAVRHWLYAAWAVAATKQPGHATARSDLASVPPACR